MAHSAPHPLAEAGFVSPALSQRAVMFIGIVAFHVVLIYLFASGLAATTVKLAFGSTEVVFRDLAPPVDQPPPLPPPVVLEQPKVIDVGPVPEGPTEDSSGTAITRTPVIPDPPAIPTVVPRIEPIHLVGKHQLPNTEDYYPPTLRREGVEGATEVNVCVDERGKRTGEPTVSRSSGNQRLDKGALDVARNGKYARSARGDTFVPNCYGFRIIFKMQ
jgi:TonB family protein